MAVVKGVKEKVHLPLYDSVTVRARQRLGETQGSNVLRFFQDVTNKTKLQTNMQAASLLPHWNTFEARALRVVISDLAPQFPEVPQGGVILPDVIISDAEGKPNCNGTVEKATLTNLNLGHYVEISRRLEEGDERAVLLSTGEMTALGIVFPNTVDDADFATFDSGTLDRLADLLEAGRVVLPPPEQIVPNNGNGNLISRLIYNSVTTLFVGEKIMIQVPTFFFPSGAGPFSEDGRSTTHGEPSPEATFRFAEPIFIDTQQNFRVEIEVPESDVLADLQRIYGPFFIWVVMDGYMTRDVQ